MVTGFHGRADGRHPTELEVCFIADEEYAKEWSEGTGVVWHVSFESKRPLDIRHASEFQHAWNESGADDVVGPFHAPPGAPSASGAFTAWCRAAGYDAVVLHAEAFDTEDQELWELIVGTFGDPQSIILDPSRCTCTALSGTI